MPVLSWNEKNLEVTGNKILTFSNFSSSSAYSTEDVDNGSRMKKTKGIAPDKGSISFDIFLDASLGVDPMTEYYWWREQVNKGASSYMYLGGEPFGVYKWMLVRVDQNGLITYSDGTWKQCQLTLSFQEEYTKTVAETIATHKSVVAINKKLAKALQTAQTAKSEAARKQAALQAAALQKQLEETQRQVAEEMAAKKKAEADLKAAAEGNVGQYYDMLIEGGDQKAMKKEINSKENKNFSKEVQKIFKQLIKKNNTQTFYEVDPMYQEELLRQIEVNKYYVDDDGMVKKRKLV